MIFSILDFKTNNNIFWTQKNQKLGIIFEFMNYFSLEKNIAKFISFQLLCFLPFSLPLRQVCSFSV